MKLLLTPHLHLFLSPAHLVPQSESFLFLIFLLPPFPLGDVHFFHYAAADLMAQPGQSACVRPALAVSYGYQTDALPRKQRLHFLCFPLHNEFETRPADETNVFVDKRLIFTDFSFRPEGGTVTISIPLSCQICRKRPAIMSALMMMSGVKSLRTRFFECRLQRKML
jgi:hypothetical protein